jgi:thioredoxin reductase
MTNEPALESPAVDAVVIGGGAAGLSAGVVLARAGRSVTVVDAGGPRNAPASHVHGFLTRDGVAPSDLVALGAKEVVGYGGQIMEGEVATARATADGFDIGLDDGTELRTRRIVLASGVVDQLPDVPGLADRWGIDVLHCPYCHGYEVRGQHIAILGNGPTAIHHALLWRQWSPSITLLVDEEFAPDPDESKQLAARGITIVQGLPDELRVSDGRLAGVRLTDGQTVDCDVLVVAPRWKLRTDLLDQLGVETAARELKGTVLGHYVPAEHDGKTSVPGVWAAGNLIDPMAQVVAAAASGTRAAASLNADLVAEDTRRAVAAGS